MHKVRIIIYLMIPILLLTGGWVIFNSRIRPNHYQLLFPYSIFHAEALAVTETRIGQNDDLQILIPAGKAIVGKGEYEAEIDIDEFWIDQIPVTAAAYKQYLSEKRALAPHYHDDYAVLWQERQYELRPVVFVSWLQAESYCEYYGGHLPTEAQWEKAARGTEGAILYWDDEAESGVSMANYNEFYKGATPAGWLPNGKTVYGVLDMAGNVREWCLDWLEFENQPVNTDGWETVKAMQIKDVGKLLKGGAYSDDLSHLRLNSRDVHEPKSPGVNRGFRCVYEAAPETR